MLALCCFGLALATEVAAPIAVDADALEPIGFTRVVVRDPDSFHIGVAPEAWRQVALQELRAAGYPTRGGESLLFDQDLTGEAVFLLGGELVDGDCEQTYTRSRCELEVEWQLFDRRSSQVVAGWRTRGTWMASDIERAIEYAWLGALHGLLADPELPAALAEPARELAAPGWGEALAVKACEAEALSMPEELEVAMNASVVLRSGGSVGAGALISPDGYLLTAAHVITGDAVEVKTRAGFTLPARVLRVDEQQDVALLHIAGAELPCLAPAAGPPRPGQALWAVGSPAGEQLAFSVTTGIVSGVRELHGGSFVQTDASLNSGNSGGPLLDEEGRVLGIVSWKMVGEGVEGLSFGVPVDVALVRLGVRLAEASDPLPLEDAPRAAPPSEPPAEVAPAVAPVYPDRPLEFPDGTPLRPPPPPPKEPPAWLAKSMRVGGITAGAGAVAVGGSWAAYRLSDNIRPAPWVALQAVNTAGWVAMAGGSWVVVGAWALKHVSLAPGQVVVQGRF